MIRNVSRCPYCGDVSAAVDDDGPEMIIAPDRTNGRPCSHLAYLIVSLGADGEVNQRLSELSREWYWSRETGTLRLNDEGRPPLVSLVTAIACELMPEGDRLRVDYQIGGATAYEREESCAGTGVFPLLGAQNSGLVWLLDGWGLYSETPDDLVREISGFACSTS